MCSVVLTELPIFQTFSTATALPIRLNGSGQLLQSSDLYLQLHNLLKRRVRNTCEISKMGLLLECQICNLPSCFLFFLLGLPVVARVQVSAVCFLPIPRFARRDHIYIIAIGFAKLSAVNMPISLLSLFVSLIYAYGLIKLFGRHSYQARSWVSSRGVRRVKMLRMKKRAPNARAARGSGGMLPREILKIVVLYNDFSCILSPLLYHFG